MSAAFLTSRLLARMACQKRAITGAQSGRFMTTSLDDKFKLAQKRVNELGPIVSFQDRLQIDTLAKRATEGKNTKGTLSGSGSDAISAYNAWHKKKNVKMSAPFTAPKTDDPKLKYVQLVNKILTKAGKEPVT